MTGDERSLDGLQPNSGFSENLDLNKSKSEKPHFHGHRDRLREKFRKSGEDALADYEILELLLFRSIPRRDTKPLAKQLIEEFGTLSEILSAPESRLAVFSGMGRSVITDLKLVHAAANTLTAENIRARDLLSSWSSVLDYCRTKMAFNEIETVRILFLDKKNYLIADEEQQSGTVDHTPVYPREVAKRAMELGATAILLVHNHPSGDPTPSRADIEMTKTIIDTLKPLGVGVHDHIIIAREGHASLKGLQLI